MATREALEQARKALSVAASIAPETAYYLETFILAQDACDKALAAEREPSLVAGSSADPVACSCGNDTFRLYRSDGVSWFCCKGCGNAYIQNGTEPAIIWMSPDVTPDDESADYLVWMDAPWTWCHYSGSVCEDAGAYMAEWHRGEFVLYTSNTERVGDRPRESGRPWARIIPPK